MLPFVATTKLTTQERRVLALAAEFWTECEKLDGLRSEEREELKTMVFKIQCFMAGRVARNIALGVLS